MEIYVNYRGKRQAIAGCFSANINIMISVDQNNCIGCGLCVGMCPEVFKMNADGKSEAFAQIESDSARDAAAGCPVNAITV